MKRRKAMQMSFREKSAWVSLAAFAAGFLVYLLNIVRVAFGQRSMPPLAEVMLLTTLIVGAVALQAVIALRSPKEARTPKDERERLIDLKATRPAFFVLVGSAFASIGTVHLPIAGARVHLKLLMLAVMLSITAAGVVKFATQVTLYRRDR